MEVEGVGGWAVVVWEVGWGWVIFFLGGGGSGLSDKRIFIEQIALKYFMKEISPKMDRHIISKIGNSPSIL